MKPVAFFHTSKKSPIEAARQGSIDLQSQAELGEIRFEAGHNFEQALEDIEGFSHLWLIYQFHKNEHHWSPKVSPPRGAHKKVGVFATRSPYRPNGLGMSCVELVGKKGLSLWVKGFDLLNGTPILDVKPYLAYSDSFPDAALGWLAQVEMEKYEVTFSKVALTQIRFLESQGVLHLQNILVQQLSFDPLNSQKKRVTSIAENQAVFAVKTWRFEIHVWNQKIEIQRAFSGYSEAEMQSPEDPYLDKSIHRAFKNFIF